jgi:HAMP domain-containing protein
MEDKSMTGARRGLANKFNLSLVVMYLIAVVVSAPAVYFLTKKQVYDRASEELALLVDIVKSIQNFVASDLRPHLMKEDVFFSPSISGIVATSKIANHFKQKQPKYYISSVSDNPLNSKNMVNGLELDLLKRFRKDRGQKTLIEIGEIDGQMYLVSSAPKVSKKGCLLCHGQPNSAPADVTETYGVVSGYGYKTNEVVGVSTVGVPIEDVQSLAINRSIYVVVTITIIFALLFLVINLLVRRLILQPIGEITEIALAVSKGEVNRDIRIEHRKDEISDLAQSFELMRRSLITAMKHLQRKS